MSVQTSNHTMVVSPAISGQITKQFMEFVIEPGLPIPKRTSPGRSGNSRPPGLMALINQMEIGESILLPNDHMAQSLQSTIQAVSEKKFTRRKVDGGCRLWRIEDDWGC